MYNLIALCSSYHFARRPHDLTRIPRQTTEWLPSQYKLGAILSPIQLANRQQMQRVRIKQHMLSLHEWRRCSRRGHGFAKTADLVIRC